MKVAFVTDSGTGIAPSKMMEKGIYSLPLQIECEGVSYDEYETIAYSTVIENLHAQKLMKTSLPNLERFKTCLKKSRIKGTMLFSVFQFVKGYLARWMQWR